MKIIFQGGPADGRMIEGTPFTGNTLIRVPAPTENFRINIHADNLYPQMQVADYRFTGLARVTMAGEVLAIIYQFESMEN